MQQEEPAQPASIVLETRPVLSYAMAHNEIPVISRLLIENVRADVHGARLRLEVADASGLLADAEEIVLDLRAGEGLGAQRSNLAESLDDSTPARDFTVDGTPDFAVVAEGCIGPTRR